MNRCRSLLLAIWLLPATVAADFRIEGGADSDFLQTAGVVAVLPALCPANVDCVWLDRRIAGEILRRQKPEFRSAATTAAALTAMGAKELDAGNRTALAAALGAQTLLEIRVRELVRDHGTGAKVRSRLEIRAISAETGKTVAEGAAFGDAPGSSEKKLLGPMLAELLARMFPLRPR